MIVEIDPEDLLGRGDRGESDVKEATNTITSNGYQEIQNMFKTKIFVLNKKMEKLDMERERLVLLIDEIAIADGTAKGRRSTRLAKLRRGD